MDISITKSLAWKFGRLHHYVVGKSRQWMTDTTEWSAE